MEAVAHLCKVACGLDSQVLGETQIMGQITGAYENALETLGAGPFVHAVFRAAIRAGKRSRTETTFSRNPASMSSVAIATAHDKLGDLRDKKILVVGMGQMGMLTLRALHARQLHNVAVANRTPEKAEAVSKHWHFEVYSLDELPAAIAGADVVITSTASPEPLIDAGLLKPALEGRNGRKLVIVDIAVPRDVDDSAGELPGVHLFDADDLKVVLDRSLEARKREIPRVEAIIAEEAAKCEIELRELSMKPVITDLRDKAETIRRGELEKTIRRLPNVDDQTIEHIHHMSRAIVNKLLHEPTVRLKRVARSGLHNEYTSTVRHLFDLPENGKN
jgi:glutamyl-tRNA reductase